MTAYVCRAMSAVRVAIGIALVTAPTRVGHLVGSASTPSPPAWLLRALGLRSLVQGLITLARPDRRIVLAGAAVDAAHAASMLPIAVRRHRPATCRGDQCRRRGHFGRRRPGRRAGAAVSRDANGRARHADTEAPHVLREYALLADGQRGAVLGPRGDIAWLCVPRWDSPSVFSSLVGGQGCYQVVPEQPYVWGGSYDEGSMIWRSRWVTRNGIVECREALAYPADAHRAVLLRRVQSLDRPCSVRVTLRPRGDYDQQVLTELRRTARVWSARVGALQLRWSGGAAAHARNHRSELHLDLELVPGESHDLVLELSDEPLPAQPPDADELWKGTERAWCDAVPQLTAALDPRDTRRSYAVLRGLTGASGGMVAAATTSLPERAEAGRNYDYRYVWIRDQCYAGIAAAATPEPLPLLDESVRFVTEQLLEHGDQLAPAYTIDGKPVPDQRHLQLPGYPGGFDIVGNQVNASSSSTRSERRSSCSPQPPGMTTLIRVIGTQQQQRQLPSPDVGTSPMRASGSWTAVRGRTAGSLLLPACVPSPLRHQPPAPPRNGPPSQTGSSPTPPPRPCTPTGTGSARPTTPASTPRCCGRRCAARSRSRTRAASRRSMPTGAS